MRSAIVDLDKKTPYSLDPEKNRSSSLAIVHFVHISLANTI
jgi:hypothetical protein